MLKEKREEQLKDLIKYGRNHEFIDSYSNQEHRELDTLFAFYQRIKKAETSIDREIIKEEVRDYLSKRKG
ncbi:hypothetical protein [Oceanobacillus salinisoli]|uniref:hypothetical protein n=1 Tax=Oceanobacillus salinisoli TaxID=2678611 RepID=UPI0012E1BFFB|nr:hypothetical protein [Oceanobacillus salinisoli]